jgi:hypothetical protein
MKEMGHDMGPLTTAIFSLDVKIHALVPDVRVVTRQHPDPLASAEADTSPANSLKLSGQRAPAPALSAFFVMLAYSLARVTTNFARPGSLGKDQANPTARIWARGGSRCRLGPESQSPKLHHITSQPHRTQPDLAPEPEILLLMRSMTPITLITLFTPMISMGRSEAFVQQPVAGGIRSNFSGVGPANGDASSIRAKAH